MEAPELYVDQLVPLLILYSYVSADPEDPPDPAVIVAFGLYPAHIDVPLDGVAVFNVGFTVVDDTGQVHIVLHEELLQP